MSDVWEGEKGKELVHDVCHALGAVFATVFLLGRGGQELANATTIEEEGYNPCWNTTRLMAHSARSGDIFGLTSNNRGDSARDTTETPKADGAGLQLFYEGEVVGVIGVLGVSPNEAVAAVGAVAQDYGLTTTACPS